MEVSYKALHEFACSLTTMKRRTLLKAFSPKATKKTSLLSVLTVVLPPLLLGVSPNASVCNIKKTYNNR
jgi:hypothetical protein